MSERQLASIQRIIDIQPIEGADAIEVATVNGWKVVVKKGEFVVDTLVIYCEIDSFIPTVVAPFLTKPGHFAKVYEGVEGERLRTVKLRGQISQGLILGTDIISNWDLVEGLDVSEKLNIIKYEPPIAACLSGVVKGNFPSQVPKTDEERVQNIKSRDWELFREHTYEVTEKLEGSSCTMALIAGEFIVCSRNLNLKEDENNTFWKMARKYDVENKLRGGGYDNIAIQGEVIGESIQENYYGIKGQEFYVFSIYDIVAGAYVSPVNRKEMCKQIQLHHVPVIGELPMHVISPDSTEIQPVLNYANGQSVINPSKRREGLVFKRIDGPEHFKAISNDYLLKQKD